MRIGLEYFLLRISGEQNTFFFLILFFFFWYFCALFHYLQWYFLLRISLYFLVFWETKWHWLNWTTLFMFSIAVPRAAIQKLEWVLRHIYVQHLLRLKKLCFIPWPLFTCFLILLGSWVTERTSWQIFLVLQFQFANYSSPKYKDTGKGVLNLQLINQRSDFAFALFSGGLSNVISPPKKFPWAKPQRNIIYCCFLTVSPFHLWGCILDLGLFFFFHLLFLLL